MSAQKIILKISLQFTRLPFTRKLIAAGQKEEEHIRLYYRFTRAARTQTIRNKHKEKKNSGQVVFRCVRERERYRPTTGLGGLIYTHRRVAETDDHRQKSVVDRIYTSIILYILLYLYVIINVHSSLTTHTGGRRGTTHRCVVVTSATCDVSGHRRRRNDGKLR